MGVTRRRRAALGSGCGSARVWGRRCRTGSVAVRAVRAVRAAAPRSGPARTLRTVQRARRAPRDGFGSEGPAVCMRGGGMELAGPRQAEQVAQLDLNPFTTRPGRGTLISRFSSFEHSRPGTRVRPVHLRVLLISHKQGSKSSEVSFFLFRLLLRDVIRGNAN